MDFRLGLILVVVALACGTEGAPSPFKPFEFAKEAWQGAGDMYDAYRDLKESRRGDADKYFHARGNYDAARRGPGGKWAAKTISNGKEAWDVLRWNVPFMKTGHSYEDSLADQEANRWGRNGGHPNKYRPEGLPPKYNARP